MVTGIGMPFSWSWVLALNDLQNSMMFRPRWPSAGPMGGDGLALPAGTCSLIKPTIFFATIGSYRVPAPSPRARLLVALKKLNLLDLREIQLHRRCATEDGDRHAH